MELCGGEDLTPRLKSHVNMSLRMVQQSQSESTLLLFHASTVRRSPWRPLGRTSWRRLSTPRSPRSTWMLTPSSTSTLVVTLLSEAPWEMLVLLEGKSLSILMEVGELMVVELSLARITPRWTEVLPMLLDGLPSLLSRLVFARDVLYRFPMLLV